MSTPETAFEQLLRDELTPVPDPAFAAELDEWAAAGFPRTSRRRSPFGWLGGVKRALGTPFGLTATGSAVAAVAIALLLQGGTSDDGSQSFSGGGGRDSAGGSGAAPALALPSTREQTAPGIVAPGDRDQRIQRSSQITLAAPADDFQSVADRIVQVTDRHNGFVLLSNVTTGENPSGEFQLRVPAGELQATLRDITALGDVRARSDTGQNVTREYVSVTDQLDAARAERRALLRRLASATDDQRIQRLRDRLDRNARELADLRTQVRDLRERTNYAAVSVTLVARKGGAGAGGGSGTGAALHDSVKLLVGSFNWLLRALGILIPAGIVGGAAWWAGRTLRRRRREAVLS
jgi:hypothetical protein